MKVFRITHKKWSKQLTASGFPARWNSGGVFIVYTAESRALAYLESVVHRGLADFSIPFIMMEILVPDDLKIKEISTKDLPSGWNEIGDLGYRKCQPIGDNWISRAESAILKVPSALVAKESNYLFNPNHPEFTKIKIKSEVPFIFDDRIKK